MINFKDIHIFESLNDEQLSLIESISIKKSYDKDAIVFYEGDEPEYFYVLTKGSSKVYKVDSKGNEIQLHTFIAPSLVAEMASLEDFKFPATCSCMQDSEFILIQKKKFIDILQTNSQISFEIIKSLNRKLKAMEGVLNRSLIFDATTKVALYIDKDPLIFKNKKNKLIASELNMTAETLSRVLKKLKDIHIIDNDLNLLDKQKLQMFINF